MSNPIDSTISQSVIPTAAQYSVDAAIKIDWFNFETRMRSLVRDMLDPCIDAQYDNNKTTKSLSNRFETIEAQVQELEYQATKLDVIFKKIDDLEASFNNERQSKDEDLQQLQSEIVNVQTNINTARHEIGIHSEQLKKAQEEYDKLHKEQTVTNNRIVANKEDIMNVVSENNKSLLQSLQQVSERLQEEESKQREFELMISNFKEALEKHNTGLAEVDMKANQFTKNFEAVEQQKVGIEMFDKLSNKIYRKLDELEHNNTKSSKEVLHMENYIRSLAKSVGGHGKFEINPYSVVKYHYALKDPKMQTYIAKKLTPIQKPPSWQKARDDMFYIVKDIDSRYDSIKVNEKPGKKRRMSIPLVSNLLIKPTEEVVQSQSKKDPKVDPTKASPKMKPSQVRNIV